MNEGGIRVKRTVGLLLCAALLLSVLPGLTAPYAAAWFSDPEGGPTRSTSDWPQSEFASAIDMVLDQEYDLPIPEGKDALWFRFTPEISDGYVFNNHSSAGLIGEVYTASGEIYYDPGIGGGNGIFGFKVDLVAGDTYYFAAEDFYGEKPDTVKVSLTRFVAPTSGECGENLKWSLNTKKKILTVTGSGEMNNYFFVPPTGAPWYYSGADITEIRLPKGLTTIGSEAFSGFTALREVNIPAAVTSIGGYSFFDSAALEEVYYGSDSKAWAKITFEGYDDDMTKSNLEGARFHYNTASGVGHWTHKETAATCTKSGESYELCDCGFKRNVVKIAALGHNYVNGVCTRCGKADPNYNPVGTPVITASNVVSSGKVKLTWEAVSGANAYKVYRADSKDGSYTLMKTVTDGTSYVNTTAEAGKAYWYKVKAVNTDLGLSGQFSAVKSRTCDLPQPVVTGTHDAATGKNKITWKAVDGAKEYKVYRSGSKSSGYKLMKTTTDLSYVNTGAKAGETWYYKVMAVHSKSAANSAYSEIKTITCDLPRPVVTISLSSGKPKLSWKAIEGAKAYKVYRSESKSSGYELIKTTTSLVYTNTKAVKGKTYYYKVMAIHEKSAANSAHSLVKSIKATK